MKSFVDEPDSEYWAEFALVVQQIARLAHVMALRRSEVDVLALNVEGALKFVFANPNCRIQDIAEALLLAPANASAAITQLHELGLVSKKSDCRDRRIVRVRATAKAQKGQATVNAMWTDIYQHAARQLGAEHQEKLRAALPALRQMAHLMTANENAEKPSRHPSQTS